MICIDARELLSIAAEFFECFVPVVLFCWFWYARWDKLKSEYLKELPGLYGGWVTDTVNKSTNAIRYDAGLTMDIFDIDHNGYFRGQFDYIEKEVTLGV